MRSYASVATSRLLCPGGHWSKAMITSAPSARSISITRSGVKRCVEPSMWLRKVTPSSSIVLMSESENTWNPPESVRIGRFHPWKRCSPPISRTTSCPGRRYR